MALNNHWLEKKFRQECNDTDVYTIVKLYMDLIKICNQEVLEDSIEKMG
ncbi:hypothetical protein KOY_05365 [Bacillus cereus VDM021]|nr:hypothetical protein KOY_05365 [Bacillus cereus VDM021]